MPNPVVSVLLPVGRPDRFLAEALASLQAQTVREFEVLFLASPGLDDYLQSQMHATACTFPFQICTVRLANLAFALNVGLERSASRYVARMDSDDVCSPTRFAAQIKHLDENPDCGVVGLRTVLIDDTGQPLRGQRFPYHGSDAEIRRILRRKNPLCHPAVMFRRTALERVGGYRYGNAAEDHELYLRLARDRAFRFINLAEPPFYYRRHPGQLTDPKRAYEAFSEIAGFMFTELLRSLNPAYVAGIIRYHPFIRYIGAKINRVRAFMVKAKR